MLDLTLHALELLFEFFEFLAFDEDALVEVEEVLEGLVAIGESFQFGRLARGGRALLAEPEADAEGGDPEAFGCGCGSSSSFPGVYFLNVGEDFTSFFG